jgi:1,4-dihydroxy-2-naphthoate polyprenyltransferase
MSIKSWLQAFRLRTLPLALASIGMAGFLAASANVFRLSVFMGCVMTTIFLQILSNLANDYGDSIHGADHAGRKGPPRAVQSGTISLFHMKIAVIIFSLLSLVSGIVLIYLSVGLNGTTFFFFLGLGVLSILAAIGYTVGKKPYGYVGLGDISVLIFFGWVGVMGSYYLFAQQIEWTILLPATSCGLFAVGVLNINNIRDIESDLTAGKYSIPVRIGKQRAAYYHIFLIIGGLVCACIFSYLHWKSPWQLLFLMTAFVFIPIGKSVLDKPSAELDPYLKRMALSSLLFVVLFGLGLLASSQTID